MSQTLQAQQAVARPAGLITRLRRNHAIEHATMSLLVASRQGTRLVGRSGQGGFHIYGDAPTKRVLEAAREGLRRLQGGHRYLAVHPNCGTNLVLAGLFAGLGTYLALAGSRSRWERIGRLPFACAAAMLGIVVGRALGPHAQARLSTDADVEGMRISAVTASQWLGVTDHYVRTEG
jgi:hypothetical protein